MAKGNDGNYLQHVVETKLAALLTAGGGDLHVTLTHGMEPWEACDPAGGVRKARLNEALDRARQARTSWEQPLVTAYRALRASRARYPNSAELIAALIGEDHLRGVVVERDPDKFPVLRDRWAGHALAVLEGSWRDYRDPGGSLQAPENLDGPWLFSMDPYTFQPGRTLRDQANLNDDDIERLAPLLSSYVATGQPGAASIFVYYVDDATQDAFEHAVARLGDATGLGHRFLHLTHKVIEGTAFRNVAALAGAPALIEQVDLEPPAPPQSIGTIS